MAPPGGQRQTATGVALQQARRTKKTTYPELSGEGGRARLVVLTVEVELRWSEETAQFLRALANPDPPEPRQGGMAPQMEQRVGLQRGHGFRVVPPGQPGESRDRCRHTPGARGAEG